MRRTSPFVHVPASRRLPFAARCRFVERCRSFHETRNPDYVGLGFRHLLLGITMAIFMLSLTGIPPRAGFAGKLYIFVAYRRALAKGGPYELLR